MCDIFKKTKAKNGHVVFRWTSARSNKRSNKRLYNKTIIVSHHQVSIQLSIWLTGDFLHKKSIHSLCLIENVKTYVYFIHFLTNKWCITLPVNYQVTFIFLTLILFDGFELVGNGWQAVYGYIWIMEKPL